MTKIGRFSDPDTAEPFWGFVDSNEGRVSPILQPFSEWAEAVSAGLTENVEIKPESIALGSLRILAPYEAPAHVYNCGASYWAHLEATGYFDEPPPVPVACFKPDSAIIGPGDVIRYPSYTNKLDFEGEIVAVVGRTLPPDEPASAALLGFTLGNDISVRDTEDPLGAPDLYTMKGADASCPLGPWIVTSDEFGSPARPDMDFGLSVNGEVRQSDNTTNMIFTIDYALTWINERNLLGPGDLLFTGTTAGPVGENREAPAESYLQPGDTIEVWADGIGSLRNVVGEKEHPRRPPVPRLA